MLAVLDPNITIDVIKDGAIMEKRKLNMPEHVTNIIRCKNPRCITSIEQELPHRFKLTNRLKGVYRCTLIRALKEYPAYLTSTDSWGRVLSNIGLGYVFIIIGIFVEYKSMVAKKA